MVEQTDVKQRLATLRAALAARPCPTCRDSYGVLKYGEGVNPCLACEGTGLAFPWASELIHSRLVEGVIHNPDCPCIDGSGRVPKANLGLEELLAIGQDWELMKLYPALGWEAWYYPDNREWHRGEGETPILAALRAVAKAGMR